MQQKRQMLMVTAAAQRQAASHLLVGMGLRRTEQAGSRRLHVIAMKGHTYWIKREYFSPQWIRSARSLNFDSKSSSHRLAENMPKTRNAPLQLHY